MENDILGHLLFAVVAAFISYEGFRCYYNNKEILETKGAPLDNKTKMCYMTAWAAGAAFAWQGIIITWVISFS